MAIIVNHQKAKLTIMPSIYRWLNIMTSIDPALIGAVYNFFQEQGYHWKLDGKFVDPTPDMIEEVLMNMQEAIADEPDLSIRQGRMMVQRDGNHFEVWVYAGEI